MGFCRRLFCVALSLAILLPVFCAYAKSDSAFGERFIGSSVKLLARSYVALIDFDDFKRKTSSRLRAMDDETFQRRYAGMLRTVDSLPTALQREYRLNGSLSREDALAVLDTFDRNKTYKLIDAVPDALIAARFRAYLARNQQPSSKTDMIEEIKRFWNKFITSLSGS